MNLIELLGPTLAPLVASYLDGKLPEAPKRLLYVLICALGTEAKTVIQKSVTGLDDAALDALLAEAAEEFIEAGLHELPSALDEFVGFKVA